MILKKKGGGEDFSGKRIEIPRIRTFPFPMPGIFRSILFPYPGFLSESSSWKRYIGVSRILSCRPELTAFLKFSTSIRHAIRYSQRHCT